LRINGDISKVGAKLPVFAAGAAPFRQEFAVTVEFLDTAIADIANVYGPKLAKLRPAAR